MADLWNMCDTEMQEQNCRIRWKWLKGKLQSSIYHIIYIYTTWGSLSVTMSAAILQM